MNEFPLTVLAVDDQPPNLRLLDAVLAPRGYHVIRAGSGREALELLEKLDIDLVLLDVVMPELDGYEVCRRIRAQARTAYLPVVMITASGGEQRLAALEAGADDFVMKPFDQSELLARVASLGRLKRYHDTIERQATELAAWNAELEERVAHNVAELDRINRLRYFLSPQLAEVVVGDQELLASHRREIVVMFCDFHGFTTFAETSEPEEVMGVLAEYHGVVGSHVHRNEGTLERFTGTGRRFSYRQRIAWPGSPAWEEVRELGLWMVERLSINGHVLVGLRARPETAPAEEARRITPEWRTLVTSIRICPVTRLTPAVTTCTRTAPSCM